MSKEINQSIHPEDKEFITRRESLRRILKSASISGYASAIGAVAHIFYQVAQNSKAAVELNKTHPMQSQKDIDFSNRLIDEHAQYKDYPKRVVVWAQQKINQQKAHDEEYAKRFPDGIMPWIKTDTTIFIGGAVVGIGSTLAKWRVERKMSYYLEEIFCAKYMMHLLEWIGHNKQ